MLTSALTGRSVAAVPALTFGALSLDGANGCATAFGADLPMSPAEFATLFTLVRRRDTPMSREAVVSALAEMGLRCDPRLVDVHVCQLRRRLAAAGLDGLISTAWGRGYVVTTPEEDGALPLIPQAGWRSECAPVLAEV